MAYEGRTNTSSYITAGIAGGEALSTNLKATKSTDFTKLSNTIADARALQEKALIQGKLAKDKAKMTADSLLDKGKKFKKDAEKPRMAGKLAAFALQGAGGYLAGRELKNQINQKYENDEFFKKLRDSISGKKVEVPTDASTLTGYRDPNDELRAADEWRAGQNSGGGGKKDSGKVTTQSTGSTVKPTKVLQPFEGTPAGKYGQNWVGLSSVIRFAEGTDSKNGYNTMFGHRQFTDMSKHPNNPAPTPWGTQSEAAGAYQFMKPTWDRVQSKLNLPDFTPASQELGGRWLTQYRGVDPDAAITTRSDFIAAMDKLAPEWAGLPYSGKGRNGGGYGSSFYGQGGKSIEQLIPVYEKAMGITLK